MPRHRRKPFHHKLRDFIGASARTLTGLLLIAVLLGSATAGMQWLRDPYRFPLRVVKIDGDFSNLDSEVLQESIAPLVEGGFFSVDVAGIHRSVEALPWVYRAVVQRKWPDALVVRIEEQEAIARWGERGYLNRYGESFFPAKVIADPKLPLLSGPEGREHAVLEGFRHTNMSLMPLAMQVVAIRLDERRAWHVQLDNGVLLELGRADIEQRLQRFARSYPKLLEEQTDRLERVDLRYSNGFSAYWTETVAAIDAG